MKVIRGPHSLAKLVGTEATLDELAALVREAMRQPLSEEERRDYWGIRLAGVPSWKMFTELSNVETVEDLIAAEENGAYFEPRDRPGEMYMFACGRGLVARVAPGMLPQMLRKNTAGADGDGGSSGAPSKTMEELHDEYKAAPVNARDGAEWERDLQEIAVDYVRWACGPPKL